MTNHRRQSLPRLNISTRQWALTVAFAILAGLALGWSLCQIRAEREMKEQPQPVVAPAVPAVHLRQWPAPTAIEVTEGPDGIRFDL